MIVIISKKRYERMQNAIQKARKQFEIYEENHINKISNAATVEDAALAAAKARTNRYLVHEMDWAL